MKLHSTYEECINSFMERKCNIFALLQKVTSFFFFLDDANNDDVMKYIVDAGRLKYHA